ncbi:MAG: DUF2804 family protein [Clostridia bacterium]
MKLNYPDYISTKRIPVPSPTNLVENGQAHFGTFETPIPNMNLLDCVKPCGKLMPHFLNKTRLTVWEAFEINMDECTVVSAVYNMGALGFNICALYDKAEKKVYSWQNFAQGKRCIVAPNLIDSFSMLKTKKSILKINNKFQIGLCSAECKMTNKKSGSVEYLISAERISPPSIVSIPFDKNKPLYSEKDFLKADGFVAINGKKYYTNERSTVIVDDHKGYYPFKAHYDWLTTMGKTLLSGQEKYLAVNFTHNQSIDEEAFNENVLWLEGESIALPPVKFEKVSKTNWRIYDERGTIEVFFDMADEFNMMVHLGLIDITYRLPFGNVRGFISANGTRYALDGMSGIAEDRSQRI